MAKTKVISIVRERGQVTIPDTIRKIAKWVSPSSVITISLEKPDEIHIKPREIEDMIQWDKIWDAIRLARSFRGKRRNISSFIAHDREHGHD